MHGLSILTTCVFICLQNICNLLYTNTGGLVLPRGAGVTYGSGESGEEYFMEEASPGDIVPDILDVVPAARKEYSNVDVGGEVQVTLGDAVPVKGTHWGQGIVLLDRDRDRIRDW